MDKPNELKAVNSAQPPEKQAKIPVKKTVAPTPAYLFTSDFGHLSNSSMSAAEQNKKNLNMNPYVRFCSLIIIPC